MATLIDAVPPALVAPALESSLIAHSSPAIIHNSNAATVRTGTVTVTLQGINDAPQPTSTLRSNETSPIAAPPQTVTITLQGTNDPPALSAPLRSNSPAPRLDAPTQMTVTITLQAVNDAPNAS